jgi:head-tail adaptor
MRVALELLGASTALDTYGQPIRTVNAAGTGTILFAEISDATPSERMNHKQLDQTVSHRLRMRWHPDVTHRSQLQTVSTAGGMTRRVWEIVTVTDWRERREFLDCMATEIVQ